HQGYILPPLVNSFLEITLNNLFLGSSFSNKIIKFNRPKTSAIGKDQADDPIKYFSAKENQNLE
ncbi:MAG: hypothetical protein RM368_35490, partial [Nostoc sp. DedSLP03]|uniref:hypothetical protein n=1 Tax=Nostoc sp. DedSLP03 TaxID=3075400 RepID=UPI002AD32AC8